MTYRLFAFVVFAALLVSAPASGSTEVTMDASWWNELDEGNQITAIQAGNEAYMTGFNDGAVYAAIALDAYAFKNLKPAQRDLVQSITSYPIKMAAYQGPYFPSTFGTYVHGVSDFYANHPDASRATIGSVISCLATRAHTDCDTVAKMAARSSH